MLREALIRFRRLNCRLLLKVMRILFDHSTPAPLRRYLQGHVVVEAVERGYERLSNGTLLPAAGSEAFEVFITADKNMQYKQNL